MAHPDDGFMEAFEQKAARAVPETEALQDELNKRHEHARMEADRLHTLANEQDRIVDALGSALDRLSSDSPAPADGRANY